MSDPDTGSDRRMAARSRYCRFWSSAVSGPGIRVIELHILWMQVQLLSINMGRCWPPSALAGVRRMRRTGGSIGPSPSNAATAL